MSRIVVVIGALALGCGAAVAGADSPAQPVYTSKLRFRIPYQYDAAEMQRLGAREIRLYVSVDRGITWQLVQNVAPQARKFDFDAPADGEYWFAVRTLDARNQLHPESNVMLAGLKVVVDTTAPTLEIRLRQAAPGRVELAWEADDAHLDPESLRLEFIQSGGAEWQPVSVLPQASGRTSWSVPEGGFVAVRGRVSDLASNTGQAQNQIRIEPAAARRPQEPVPDFSQPIAAEMDHDDLGTQLAEEFRRTAPPEPLAPAPLMAGPRRPDRTEASPALRTPDAGANTPGLAQPVSDTPASRPAIVRDRQVAAPSPPPASVPARARIVRSRKFQIDYSVEDVGPSGVSRVDLFITENDGEEWFKYGSDPDRQSPFAVEVPGDGLYGFSLRVRSGAGLAANPPVAGEKPEMLVLVDETPPVVQLLPAQQGQGAAINQITIRWKISDAFPAEKPVSLSYAADRNGPWEPIMGWQEDTSSYTWTVGSSVPKRFYLRLTARDAAGNVTRVESPAPLVVDLSRPTARIVNIESAGPQ